MILCFNNLSYEEESRPWVNSIITSFEKINTLGDDIYEVLKTELHPERLSDYAKEQHFKFLHDNKIIEDDSEDDLSKMYEDFGIEW